MSLEHRKSYQFSLKNSVSTPNLFDKALIGIKDKFKSFPLYPWVPMGSGDGSTGGMDGQDRWVWGNLYGGSIWIVLYQPATRMHMCLQKSSPAPAAYFSSVGFTGGTATVRPTAPDEWGKTLNALMNVFNNPVIYNVAHSTDGKVTYAWTSSAPSATLTTWLIGEAVDVVPGWTTPHFAFFSTVSGNPSTADLVGSAGGINQEIFTPTLAGETATYTNASRIWAITHLVGGVPVNTVCTGVNPTTGKPTILDEFDLGVHMVAARGRLGTMPDVRPVCGGSQNDLMYGRRWIRHSNLVLPWDGVTEYP